MAFRELSWPRSDASCVCAPAFCAEFEARPLTFVVSAATAFCSELIWVFSGAICWSIAVFALSLRFFRYAAANAFAHAAAPALLDATQVITMSCELAGTETLTSLARAYGVSELCKVLPAVVATTPEVTIWDSV